MKFSSRTSSGWIRMEETFVALIGSPFVIGGPPRPACKGLLLVRTRLCDSVRDETFLCQLRL